MASEQLNQILTTVTGGGIVIVVLVFIFIAIFGLTAGFLTWYFVRKFQYNKTINLFQEINGRFEPVGKYRARMMNLGKGGDEIIHVLKVNKFLPKPTVQVGRNTFWFFEREDGEWINFSPGDFNLDAKELGARMLDKEMRYARTSLQDQIKERYQKGNWFKENWIMIVSIIVLFVLCLFMYLIAGKVVEGINSFSTISEKWDHISANLDKIIGRLDTIQSGGSGLKPATG